MDNNIMGLIIGSCFILIGLIILIFLLLTIYHNENNQELLIAEGIIIESSLEKKIEDYAMSTNIYGSSRDVTYKQKIKFEYIIDGVKYHSSKIYYIDFNNFFLTIKKKKVIIEKHPVNKKIKVFYTLKEKEKGFLYRKTPTEYTTFITVICFLVGSYFIWS